MKRPKYIARALAFLQNILPPTPKLFILNLRLTPHIDPLGVSSIEVYLDWATNTEANSTLFTTQQSVGAVPLNDWTGDVLFRDGYGELPLFPVALTDASGVRREWRTDRDVLGEVLLIYTVRTRQADIYARCGPLLDVQVEHDGLIGPGAGFLAVPRGTEDLDIRWSWDLSYIPGSRAVSSYGEGDVRFVAPATTLAERVFAAGTLDSYEVPEDDFALFCVFIRRNEHHCRSGTAFHNSFIFAYNAMPLPGGSEVRALEFLAHDMVHDFVLISLEGISNTMYPWFAWWPEGVAKYYSVRLLHTLGITDEQTYVSRVHAKMSAHYTSPAVRKSIAELTYGFYSDQVAQRMFYSRGYMYFLLLSELVPKHTNGKSSLDDLLREMAQRRARGAEHEFYTWLNIVEDAIGVKAADGLWNALYRGKLLVPGEGTIGSCYHLRQVLQDQFDLGFPEEGLIPKGPNQTVGVLDPGSRAAVEGGLRQTDVPTLVSTPLSLVLDDISREMEMVVLRNNEEVQIRYRPRSWSGVASWQFEGIDANK
ncbi:hypothetical protein B0A48_07974 [Cryoendolithus antarcticus]|uniref:Peptidase M61 catalytic domain-containing protein n=1 Tax=Cryoendolithus antarcticus TaxID=1507870 RepID=A0A1V8T0N4_9PEZI|nr:hypothetical protein B0A48_07974 [Cryoendolithus antarcticus]